MFKASKILLFGALALTLLVVGCFCAQAVWMATHHRYDDPESGYYHGSVHARFFGMGDEAYSFSFEGQSPPRWQWTYSTNFIYRSLQFEWRCFDAQAGRSEGSGTLRLPSLAYESSHGTGVLTRALLSEWLLGVTNGTPSGSQSVDEIFGFVQAAAYGFLPAPRHHAYHSEQPIRGRIQHFRLGLGIGAIVYIWIGIWSCMVVFFGRRFWRRHIGA